MIEQNLFELFKKFNIEFTNHEHEPIFTVEDGLHLQKLIPGAHSKNLFLRNKKKTYYCLVSVIETKTVDLKILSDSLGHGRLSFGSSEDLKKYLNLTPGSVSPYGLIFDTENKIEYILDQDFLNHEWVNFHPLINKMTVSLKPNDFLNFIEKTNHSITKLQIPEK